MKLAIMQPYAFPYIGYFQLINSVDKFIILDDVNFIMRGWINRNRLLVNGAEHLFTIPVKKASQNRLINECELSGFEWRSEILKTIEFSYRKAPHFPEAVNLLEKIFGNSETNLSRWLCLQLVEICSYLNIKTKIVESSAFYTNSHLKAQAKIIDICRQEAATDYHNPSGGTELYDKQIFKENGINLKFLKSIPTTYTQFKNDFIPFLSIIDHMMFNSTDQIKTQLNNYQLI